MKNKYNLKERKKYLFVFCFLIFAFLVSCEKSNILNQSNPKEVLNYSKYNNNKLKNFIYKNGYKISTYEAERLAGIINYYSQKNNLDPKLIVSLVAVESAFQTKAVSYAGAKGLGQLMPGTARQMGVKNVFDAEENIEGTVKYINWLKKRAKTNDLNIILASYNMGYGNVSSFLAKKRPFPTDVRKYVSDIKSLYTKV
ncbi:MAG: transglycosylase SLT domain-containing protein [Candidatus Sericytochromatia bacterium]